MPRTEAGASTQTEADHKATITAEALVNQYNSGQNSPGGADDRIGVNQNQGNTELAMSGVVAKIEAALKKINGGRLGFDGISAQNNETVLSFIARVQSTPSGAEFKTAFVQICRDRNLVREIKKGTTKNVFKQEVSRLLDVLINQNEDELDEEQRKVRSAKMQLLREILDMIDIFVPSNLNRFEIQLSSDTPKQAINWLTSRINNEPTSVNAHVSLDNLLVINIGSSTY